MLPVVHECSSAIPGEEFYQQRTLYVNPYVLERFAMGVVKGKFCFAKFYVTHVVKMQSPCSQPGLPTKKHVVECPAKDTAKGPRKLIS